jgi:hypothetical protein
MLARLVDFLEAPWLVKDLSGDFVRSNAARTRKSTAYRTWVLSKVGRELRPLRGIEAATSLQLDTTGLETRPSASTDVRLQLGVLRTQLRFFAS